MFRGGTYTLKTGNLPLLARFVNFPFGGETSFSAEIYFINMTSKLDMVWGTSEPFQMEDPKYGLIVTATKSVIADYMIRKKISFLEITVYLNELSEICRNEISREFERYGVEIQNFYVEYIAPPKIEFEILRKLKEHLLTNNRLTEQKGASASDFASSLDVGKPTVTKNRLGDEGTSTQNIGRRICPRCSATLESGMKFCGNCGSSL